MYNMYEPNQLVIGATIVAIIFIMIGHVYHEQIQSRLKIPLVSIEKVNIDLWSVTHLMLFAFFGFVKPGYPLSFFTCGVIFEVFEDLMASNKTTQMFDCVTKKESLIGNFVCNGYDDSYWYGKIDDIFINLLGYVIGQSIRTTYYTNIL